MHQWVCITPACGFFIQGMWVSECSTVNSMTKNIKDVTTDRQIYPLSANNFVTPIAWLIYKIMLLKLINKYFPYPRNICYANTLASQLVCDVSPDWECTVLNCCWFADTDVIFKASIIMLTSPSCWLLADTDVLSIMLCITVWSQNMCK